jgi:predicted RNase H-like nuclease
MIVGGADGCPGGWVVVGKDLQTGAVSWRLCANAEALIHGEPRAHVLGVDIPIGLPECGSRACDRAARQLLGTPRASSVFSAPLRPALAATSYAEACRIRFEIEAKKFSKQAWNIVSKIREVDCVLRADEEAQRRVREVHPEVSFYFLAGQRPLARGKKSAAGRAERVALLEPIFGSAVSMALKERRALAASEDDVLDAFAVLWTAERIAWGTAQTLPAKPPKDAAGLRMEMVA